MGPQKSLLEHHIFYELVEFSKDMNLSLVNATWACDMRAWLTIATTFQGGFVIEDGHF